MDHVAEIERMTAESIDAEGWLHTGDKGCVDWNGFISITGRHKELIIGAGGENVAPLAVEGVRQTLHCPGFGCED